MNLFRSAIVGKTTQRWFRKLRDDARANVALEAAFVAPFMLMLVLGGFDVVDYVLKMNKVERIGATAADLLARNDTVRDGMTVVQGNEIGVFFQAADQSALPLDINANGRVIISAVNNADGNGPRVAWQRTGNYTLAVSSRLGQEGDPAVLPTGFVVRMGETAIIAETFYKFDAFGFAGVLFDSVTGGEETIYRQAFFKPRTGTLDVLE
jgi:hypothetical protein